MDVESLILSMRLGGFWEKAQQRILEATQCQMWYSMAPLQGSLYQEQL